MGNHWRWLVLVAILAVPVVAITGFVSYEQRQKSLRREYYEAVAAYRMYLDNERRKAENEDRSAETKASAAERAAYEKGGAYARDIEHLETVRAREARHLNREIAQLNRELNGPPPAEWERFQKAARDAAMPMTLD